MARRQRRSGRQAAVREAGRRWAPLWLVLRRSWRTHWRTLGVLTLMAGLTGGLAFAALAGARRSASSVDRFRDAAKSLDVFVATDLITGEPAGLRDLLEGPLVESYNDLVFLFVDVETTGFFFAPTSRRGLEVEEGVLIDGRRADPDEPDEIVLSTVSARDLGLGVGDTLEAGTISQTQADTMLATGEEPTELGGPLLRLRVVGIIRNGFDLADRPGDSTLTLTTPAFLDKYGEDVAVGSASHMVRLADVPGAVDRFTDGVAEAYGGEHLPSINIGHGEETLRDAISVITGALVAIALVIVAAGTVLIAAAVARHQRLAAVEAERLRELGLTRNERRSLLVGTVLPALAGGALLAPAVAVALSPLLPVGTARRVEPDPGLHADLWLLIIGTVALSAVLVVVGAVTALRIIDEDRRREMGTRRLPGAVDRFVRRLRPAPGTGVRFAVHEPRRAAPPVRPAVVGAIVGVVGLVGVAVVGASLQRLVDSPERWGTTWDVALEVPPFDRVAFREDPGREALLDNDDVEAAAALLYDEQVTINGVEAISMTFDPVKSAMVPTVIDGREPRAADEIAVGHDTLAAVDVPLGAEVTVGARSNLSETFRIVGVIAFPTLSEPTPVTTGAVLTAAGGDRLGLGDESRGDDVGTRYLAIRWASGVDPTAALDRLGGRWRVVLPVAPPEVLGLKDVEWFPLAAVGGAGAPGGDRHQPRAHRHRPQQASRARRAQRPGLRSRSAASGNRGPGHDRRPRRRAGRPAAGCRRGPSLVGDHRRLHGRRQRRLLSPGRLGGRRPRPPRRPQPDRRTPRPGRGPDTDRGRAPRRVTYQTPPNVGARPIGAL